MGSRTRALPASPLAAVVLVALLAGCAASPVGEPSPGRPGAPPSARAEGPAPTGDGGVPTGDVGAPGGTPDGTAGAVTDGAAPGAGATSGSGGVSSREGGAGLEMPEAPEPTVESLAELLDEQDGAALVPTELPGAASAVGRLAPGFPRLLRPVRSSTVGSSSVSPSGRRLQIGLVATTRLRPERVLLALRTRLVGRGLTEQPPPPSAPGSVSLAFRRGRSVVTLAVTTSGTGGTGGTGTSYSIAASLHAGGE